MSQIENNKLFITSLPSSTTSNELLETFSKFGPIRSMDLIRDKNTNKCKGFAFLIYEDPSSALEAVKSCIELKERQIVVQFQKEGKDLKNSKAEVKSRRLYVGNLPRGTTDLVLLNAFSQFGEIENAYVIKNPETGKFNNYGYVTFIKKENLLKALTTSVKIFNVVVKCRVYGDKTGFMNKVSKKKPSFFDSSQKKAINEPVNPKYKAKKPKRKIDPFVHQKMLNNPILFTKDYQSPSGITLMILEQTNWFIEKNHLKPNIRINYKNRDYAADLN